MIDNMICTLCANVMCNLKIIAVKTSRYTL